LNVSAWVWIVTLVALVAVLAVDLLIIGRRPHEPTMKEAGAWVAFYVGLALVFGVGVWALAGGQYAGEFYTGWLTEYSLSVDNLFVFVIIMARFRVPAIAQDKVLYIGIVISMLLRAVFIAAGAAAIAAASWVFYIFGAFLIYTAVKLAVEDGEEDEEYQENAMVRGLRRVLPITPDYVGNSLTTRTAGRRMVTPMVVVIAAIGIANVVFALDSIPAIFGLTTDPYVILTANAFALMGLRQLYFLIGGLLERVVYLNKGLALILAFIGFKLLIEALHGSHVDAIGPVHLPEIGIAASLAFILVTLVVTTAASLVKTRLDARRAG
jgi:TerC family integral membrane protein